MRMSMIPTGLVLLCVGCRSPESAAIRTVERWEQAVRDGDCAVVSDCILKEGDTRIGPYGGSPEAAAFWASQLDELDRDGFDGDWEARVGANDGRRIVFVYPVIPDRSSHEAIWLVEEEGEWRIGLLFVTPPDEPGL